jgi:integrase
MTLTEYAKPLRAMPVNAVETSHILEVLKPLWLTRAETASRLRGRIEKVLDAAKVKGYRKGENPAQWRGHLEHLLPRPLKLTRGHHAAMPYKDIPEFFGRCSTREAIAALGLEFTILTASRSGEVLNAQWSEFDLEAAIWIIPASRMQAGREHRVPLTKRAMAILERVKPLRGMDEAGLYVFPGRKPGKPLSGMAFDMLLRRMGLDITVHGFRSSFRDWAGNETAFPRDLIETALAHVVGDQTERAYRRSDALEKRRTLLEAWERYCEGAMADNVTVLKRSQS